MSDLEKRRLRVSGGEIAYLDLGDAEDPAVVLLHGFPTSSHLWRSVAPLFAPWMRVVVPDLLGCGDSDKPADAALGLHAQAGYVRELLDGLGIGSCAAVGHAFGGGIVQVLATQGRLDAMVLVDSIAFDAWPSEVVREAQAHVGSEAPGLSEALVRTALELGMRRPERLAAEDLAEYVRPYAGPEGADACRRSLLALDGVGLEDIGPELERLEIPALVLWGEEDPLYPPQLAERLGDVLPMAAVALLPGCSHFLPEDAPETIAPLMFEYLRSRYLGTPHTHAAGPVVVELGRPPSTRTQEKEDV